MLPHLSNLAKRLTVVLAAVAALAAVLTASAGGDRQPARHHRSRSAPEMLTNPNVCIPGTGSEGWCGDGDPATRAELFQPQGVAALPDGGFLVADSSNDVVRKVNATGVISTVAGFGDTRAERHAKTAKAIALKDPAGIAILPRGGYLIADTGNHRVLHVRPDGRVVTIAGTGVDASTGDGGPATRASMMSPEGLAVEPNGAILIADPPANRIRRVAPNGKIETFAGTGRSGFSGDGGLAKHAQLAYPTGVAVEPDGNVLIADDSNFRVRSVAPDGIITTVAGGGGQPANSTATTSTTTTSTTSTTTSSVSSSGSTSSAPGPPQSTGIVQTPGAAGLTGAGTTSGEFASATSLQLNGPTGVAVTPDGGFVIADGPVVEEVRADGSAAVIAGDGATPTAVFNGPATRTTLGDATAVAVTSHGSVLVADYATDRIRAISNGQMTTVAGSGSLQPLTVTVGSDQCPNLHVHRRGWEKFGTRPWNKPLESTMKHPVTVTVETSIRADIEIHISRGAGAVADKKRQSVPPGSTQVTLKHLPAVGTYDVKLTGTSADRTTNCADAMLHNNR